MADSEQLRAAVVAYVEASNRNDRDAVLACFAPDAVWHDPVGAPPHAGRDAVGEFWDGTRTMGAITMHLDDVVVCGDEAVARLRIEAKVGDDTYLMDVIETFVFDAAGLFTLVKAYWDPARTRTA